jgi:ADP-heptose:LPS heptosyltransferase
MIYPARAILIIEVSSFGDSLRLNDAARAVRAEYPNARIEAASSTGICQLLSAGGLVNETIDLGVLGHDGPSALRRLVRLLRHTRKHNFDLILDFSPRVDTQLLSRLFLRAQVISPSQLPRVLQVVAGLGIIQDNEETRYDDVLARLGLASTRHRVFEPSREDNEQFEAKLKRSGSRGGEPLVMLYSPSSAGRRWPIACFADVGGRLTNSFGARVIAADEPGDRRFTTHLSPLLQPRAIRLSEPSAPELIAAAARASLLITDDAGFGELAAELGSPLIELSEDPGGSASRDHRILGIASSADEVFDTACEIIQKTRTESLFRR